MKRKNKVQIIAAILEYKPKQTVGALWKKSLDNLNKILRKLKRELKS